MFLTFLFIGLLETVGECMCRGVCVCVCVCVCGGGGEREGGKEKGVKRGRNLDTGLMLHKQFSPVPPAVVEEIQFGSPDRFSS